ncbi:hypothetical protein QFC20_002705 [Naganishia adeliensis]|uniref:Uncharacterized protein n=1 Tax=Naganishia adeliensis TaxID=92952 RepID=A0ACC2WIC8_9TREE|nr:hypothetical protein QFC20_002705 [Naganishia adeliensis]
MLFSTYLFSALALLVNLSLLAVAIPQNLTERQSSCCGYTITNRGNVYFRFKHVVDLSTLNSIEELEDRGWIIADGWQSGGVNGITKQVPIGRRENVGIAKGEGLTLMVPRQDKNSPTLSVAEIQFPDAALGGIFEVTVKLTSTPGTCMGIFTSHADSGLSLGWNDEQDIEMLGASLLKAQTSPYYQPAGIQMLNYRPSYGLLLFPILPLFGTAPNQAKEATNRSPLASIPRRATINSEIAWYPTTSGSNPPRLTEYRFDGKLLTNAPKRYPSVNPSVLVLNHWSNSDPRWSAGPPAQDAIMYVKKIVAYYDKPERKATGTGVLKGTCDRAMACKVTV